MRSGLFQSSELGFRGEYAPVLHAPQGPAECERAWWAAYQGVKRRLVRLRASADAAARGIVSSPALAGPVAVTAVTLMTSGALAVDLRPVLYAAGDPGVTDTNEVYWQEIWQVDLSAARRDVQPIGTGSVVAVGLYVPICWNPLFLKLWFDNQTAAAHVVTALVEVERLG